MPYTSWKSWTTSEVLTAADLNTYVRDNGRWLSHASTGGSPTCRVYNSTTITGVSSGTAIPLDSERWDVGNMHSTVSTTSRVTVPTGGAGLYEIGGSARLSALYDGSGAGEVGVELRLNGTTTIGVSRHLVEMASARTVYETVTTLWRMAAGDYVELVISYLNMTTVDVIAGTAYSPELWARWVGE